jgi:hypothetical protein
MSREFKGSGGPTAGVMFPRSTDIFTGRRGNKAVPAACGQDKRRTINGCGSREPFGANQEDDPWIDVA